MKDIIKKKYLWKLFRISRLNGKTVVIKYGGTYG